MTRSGGRWRPDAFRERLPVPLPWTATIVATVAVGALAATWLSGRSVLFVVQSTLAAALLAGLALIASAPLVGTRAVRVLAHLLPGLLVTAVALLGTALGAAAGALASSLLTLVVLASVWGLGLVLGLAGVLVGLGARRALRRVATVGLAIAAVWGIVVLAGLVGLAVHLLVAGLDVALVEDLRDDLLPFLSLAVAFVVLPAHVFRQDLRELRSGQSVEG